MECETVTFPSLDGDPTVQLIGYLYKPANNDGRPPSKHPAIILMHGCSGLWTVEGPMNPREVDWAERFASLGYLALIIDSFRPRGVDNMCSPDTFQAKVYDARPLDAYGALAWLQARDDVAPDKVAMMGWSQGGGAVLLTARADSELRPTALPHGDFRAAVAMYPGSCHQSVFRTTWTTTIPMIVLIGGKDVWTPASPCQALTATAAAFGNDVRFEIYPTAYHDFDWPGEAITYLPQYTTANNVVPIIGFDPEARAHAVQQVPQFLADYMGG
jgi:dienelactone hydrolase